MIIREKYLSKIRPFYNVDIIKVLTGVRRCGKSVILTQIMDELRKNGVGEDEIIYLNFELEKNIFLKSHIELNEYVENKIKLDKKYYIFLDEIGRVEKWELAVNSLKSQYKDKISIFITGSNSDMLSTDLATHIAGRYVSFKIYPFTFREVCEYKNMVGKSKYELEELFDNYLTWGGMPQRFVFDNEEQIKTYLLDIYNSIVINDIVERFKIKDLDLFNRIVEYVVTNPSQVFSAESLAKYFESDSRAVAKNTLYNYLEYMTRALLISKVERFDVRGKRILNGKYKYYLTDLGLGRIKATTKRVQKGAYLENVVYNELVASGYEVCVGTFDNCEIDFIATRHDEKIYIQVAYVLADDKTIDREFGAFTSVLDNYPKLVLSTDKTDFSQDGIIHKNIIDWLMEDK